MKTQKPRTLTYFAPVEVRFTAAQIKAIIADNMETWDLTEEQASECNDEDYFLAASRLGFIELPVGSRFDDE